MDDPKETNPKQAIGVRRAPSSCVPATVEREIALAMLDGACKYGRHNYRVAGARASVYYDAARSHLEKWWEGEDFDQDTPRGVKLSHITKAISSLMVLRDAMIRGVFDDDRPPKSPDGWADEINKMAGLVLDAHPSPKEAFTEKGKDAFKEALNSFARGGVKVDFTSARPDCVPKGAPWTYVTDGKNRKVAAWIKNDGVRIEDPEMQSCPWHWTLSTLDFTGDITPELTPELSEQCRVFWEQHRPNKGTA